MPANARAATADRVKARARSALRTRSSCARRATLRSCTPFGTGAAALRCLRLKVSSKTRPSTTWSHLFAVGPTTRRRQRMLSPRTRSAMVLLFSIQRAARQSSRHFVRGDLSPGGGRRGDRSWQAPCDFGCATALGLRALSCRRRDPFAVLRRGGRHGEAAPRWDLDHRLLRVPARGIWPRDELPTRARLREHRRARRRRPSLERRRLSSRHWTLSWHRRRRRVALRSAGNQRVSDRSRGIGRRACE